VVLLDYVDTDARRYVVCVRVAEPCQWPSSQKKAAPHSGKSGSCR
jgi:hypothetical protein